VDEAKQDRPAPTSPPAPVPAPAPKKRRIGRTILIALAVLAAAAYFVVPAVARGIVADKLRAYVSTHYSGRAEFDSIGVSWGGRIEVDRLRLIPTAGPELATAERVVADVDLIKFFQDQIDADVSIERPTVTVRRIADGRTNLDAFLAPPAALPDTPLLPTRLALTLVGGLVDYDGTLAQVPRASFSTRDLNQPGALTGELSVLPGGRATLSGQLTIAQNNRVDVSGDLTCIPDRIPLTAVPHLNAERGEVSGTLTIRVRERQASGRLAARDVTLRWNNESVPIGDVDLDGTAGLDRYALTLTTGRSVRVSLESRDADTVGFTAAADVGELGEILREALKFKENVKLDGTLKAEGTANLRTLEINAAADLKDLWTIDEARRRTLVESLAHVEIEAAALEKGWEVRSVKIQSSAVQATGAGRMIGSELSGAKLDATADLNLLNARLATFMDTTDLALAGKLRARLDSQAERVSLDARADGFRVKGLEEPVDFTLTGAARVSAGATEIEELKLTSTPLDAVARGRYADALDLKVEGTARPGPLGKILGRSLAGAPVRFTGGLTGPIDALVGDLNAASPELKIDDRVLHDLVANVHGKLADQTIDAWDVTGRGYEIKATSTPQDYALTFKFDVTKLATELGYELTGGTGSGSGRLRWDDKSWTIAGKADADAVQNLKNLDAEFDIAYANDQYKINRLLVDSDRGTLTGSGTYPDSLTLKGSGDLAGFDASLAGRWTLDVTTRPDRTREKRYRLDGSVAFENLVLTSNQKRLEERSARVKLEGDLDWNAKQFTVGTGGVASTAISGAIKRGVVRWEPLPARLQEVEVDLTYVPDKLGMLLGAFIPGKLEGSAPQRFTGTLSGTLSDVEGALTSPLRDGNGSFSTALDRYTLFGLGMIGTATETLKDGVLTLNLPARANGGELKVDARVDLRPPGRDPPQTRAQIDMKNVLLNEDATPAIEGISPIFHGSRGRMRGTATGKMEVVFSGPIPIEGDAREAARRHLTGSGSLLIRELVLEGSPFLQSVMGVLGLDPNARDGEFNLPAFTMRNGNVEYDRLVVKLQGATLGFRGRVGYDGTLHQDMYIPISEKMLKKNPKWAPLLGTVLTVPVRGTIDAPKFEWDGAIVGAIKEAGKRKLESEIEKQLQKLFKP
jgi:hypothetical protein